MSNDWIKWEGEKWYDHTPSGPCPCPADMEVGAFYRVGSRPSTDSFFKSWGEFISGHAGGIDWSCVARWRPDHDKYECKFERNKLVAYRRKEKTRD